MSEIIKSSNVPEVSSLDDVSRWHKAEALVLNDKLEVAKAKPPTIADKIEAWQALNDRQKKRKCLTRLKNVFRRPAKIMLKLRIKGDDVINAAEEGLKPYRLEKIIQTYGKVRDKLLDSIEVARDFNDTYPEAALAVGSFEWNDDIPKTVDEKGFLNIFTSDGLKRAKINDNDASESSEAAS